MRTRPGSLWSGNASWLNGEGTTAKWIVATSQVAKTIASQGAAPTTMAQMILTEDLADWDYLALHVKATKIAGTTAMVWTLREFHIWPMLNGEDMVMLPDFPGPGHFPIFYENGSGSLTSLNRGPQGTYAGSNLPIRDSAALNDVNRAVLLITSSHVHAKIRPYGRVALAFRFQPNTAITATQTWAFEVRFHYA